MIQFTHKCCCGSEIHLQDDNLSKETVMAMQQQIDKWLKDHQTCRTLYLSTLHSNKNSRLDGLPPENVTIVGTAKGRQ